MSVFTAERVSAMRRELAEGLSSSRLFQNAQFAAVLRADEENVAIRVDGENSAVEYGASDADFALVGPASAWEGYLSGDGKVRHSSPVGMIFAEQMSGGVLASELALEGDMTEMFANLPILSRIMESAARPHGA